MALVRAPGVTAEQSGDRVVVLDADAKRMSTLNPVGALLFNALTTPHTSAELVGILQGYFPDVAVDTLTADVAEFLDQMREADLIVSADALG